MNILLSRNFLCNYKNCILVSNYYVNATGFQVQRHSYSNSNHMSLESMFYRSNVLKLFMVDMVFENLYVYE